MKAAHRQISGRELDIVLDWATGGTPEGDKAQTPPETSLRIDWASGHPDLVAQMPNRYHMNVTALEATHESALPDSHAITRDGRSIGSPSRQPGHRPQRGTVAAIAGRHDPRARHVGAAAGTAPRSR